MEQKTTGGTKPWLQYYDEGIPATIDYPQVPLDRMLAETAAKHPDHPAIIFGARVGTRLMDQAMSYRQLDDAVNRFAAAMQTLGVKKGDRVAMYLLNCPQFVIAYYGTLRAGGIAVPGNFIYTSGEMEHERVVGPSAPMTQRGRSGSRASAWSAAFRAMRAAARFISRAASSRP